MPLYRARSLTFRDYRVKIQTLDSIKHNIMNRSKDINGCSIPEQEEQYDETAYYTHIDHLVAAMDQTSPSFTTIPQELITEMPQYVWQELFYTKLPRDRYPEQIAQELGKLVGYLQNQRTIRIIQGYSPSGTGDTESQPLDLGTYRSRLLTYALTEGEGDTMQLLRYTIGNSDWVWGTNARGDHISFQRGYKSYVIVKVAEAIRKPEPNDLRSVPRTVTTFIIDENGQVTTSAAIEQIYFVEKDQVPTGQTRQVSPSIDLETALTGFEEVYRGEEVGGVKDTVGRAIRKFLGTERKTDSTQTRL